MRDAAAFPTDKAQIEAAGRVQAPPTKKEISAGLDPLPYRVYAKKRMSGLWATG